MCFVPVVVDWLLHVALPFSYNKIVTNVIVIIITSVLWLVTAFLSVVSVVNCTFVYQPSVGECILITSQLGIFPVIQLLTVLIIIGTSIYFRYKIFKSTKLFNSFQRSTAERNKALLQENFWKSYKRN